MNEILIAMAKSGSILVPIVIFTIIVSMAAVKRGEGLMGGHDLPSGAHGYVAVAAQPAAAVKIETRDGTVLEILVFGIILFTLAMGLLIGFSVLAHI